MAQHSLAIEALGWAATATFVGSYFAKRSATLVRVQIAGALMWTIYGALVGAAPVIAANVLVMAAAAWKARSAKDRDELSPPETPAPGAMTPQGS